MRSNTADRYASYQIALASGFMSVNEVRALEDLPPVPDGDLPRAAAPAPAEGVPQAAAA